MSSLFSAFTRSPANEGEQQRSSGHPPTPQQRTEEARAAFDASLRSAGSAIDSDLQSRAKTIHENATHLGEQDERVQTETLALSRDADAIEKALLKTEKSLQAAGRGHDATDKGTADQFEDEIARLEQDLDFLDDMLNEVEGKHPSVPEEK